MGTLSDERVRVVVTGKRGVGKTTVCEKAYRILRAEGWRCGGILTRKVKDSLGRIQGIEILDLWVDPPEARPLATTRPERADGPRIGPYAFLQSGLAFGRKALRRGFAEGDVLFGDELGYLELQGGGFDLLLDMLSAESGPRVAVVIRSDLLDETLSRLHGVKIHVLEVTVPNRDRAALDLCRMLSSPSADGHGR